MKAIMVMFDSLNKHFLPCYGCDWTKLPNFKRLAEKTVVFDNFYVGSMPCMPARRELHTGRYNFLHRSWGPLEPFDDSMPEILKKSGVYTHLVSDHYHYWEDGGANYHTKYSSWEAVRGQEGDFCIGQVKDPEIPECITPRDLMPNWRHDWINRTFMNSEEKMPQAITFSKGIDFIDRNKNEDDWFLQIETFDPHEPFYTQQVYKDLYPDEYDGPHYDWPIYGNVPQREGALKHLRYEYAALLSMCDTYLGKVLDKIDEYNMWDDTMLIVNTDHGFLLGEKQWLGKNMPSWYNETANTPFFMYDPRSKVQNERRQALAQTIDIAPTLLEYFGADIPEDMQGRSLKNVVSDDEKIRDAALFGIHGGHVNITDGRYVYMRASNLCNAPLYEYTLMPSNMKSMMPVKVLKNSKFGAKFDFTKGVPTMKIKPAMVFVNSFLQGNRLYDLSIDPLQENPIDDAGIEAEMTKIMADAMIKNDTPKEQFKRIAMASKGLSASAIKAEKRKRAKFEKDLRKYFDVKFEGSSFEGIIVLLSRAPKMAHIPLKMKLKKYIKDNKLDVIDDNTIMKFMEPMLPPMMKKMMGAFYGAYTRRN